MEKLKTTAVKYRRVFLLLALAVLCVLPLLIQKAVLMRHICNVLIYATLASSLNIINGYTGQTCLGQAGFFAVGAYTCAILTTNYGWNFWAVMLMGGLLAALVGFLVSLPTLRLQGIYLSFVTLGFSEIIRIIAQTWTPVTGGNMGIKGIPYPMLFGTELFRPHHYYYLLLAVLVLFLFLTNRVLKSRVGRAWISIREEQNAARSLGVEISRYKNP